MDRPKLQLQTVILSLFFTHLNGQHISVNLKQCLIGLFKTTIVGCNFEPSQSKVLERNFRPSKNTVVERNIGPSKIMVVFFIESGPHR